MSGTEAPPLLVFVVARTVVERLSDGHVRTQSTEGTRESLLVVLAEALSSVARTPAPKDGG